LIGPWFQWLAEPVVEQSLQAAERNHGAHTEEDQVAEARLPALHGNGAEGSRDRHGVAERCRISGAPAVPVGDVSG